MGEEETRMTVNIFGTNYKLKDQTGTSREHIIKVARRVDEKMRDIANSNKKARKSRSLKKWWWSWPSSVMRWDDLSRKWSSCVPKMSVFAKRKLSVNV